MSAVIALEPIIVSQNKMCINSHGVKYSVEIRCVALLSRGEACDAMRLMAVAAQVSTIQESINMVGCRFEFVEKFLSSMNVGCAKNSHTTCYSPFLDLCIFIIPYL